MDGGIKTTLRVGLLLLLTGSVVALATWPHSETDALGATYSESGLWADLGLAAAMLGILLVLLVGIGYGARRIESVNQDDKP
jgi:hypothetical protein